MTNAALREDQRERVAILLEAHRSLPLLAQRLSAGFLTFSPAETLQWSGWLKALKTEVAWSIIEPALDDPRPWPGLWDRARGVGFTAATEHYLAIFFTHLFVESLPRDQLELPRRAFSEAMRSWRSLADGQYLRDVILAATPGLTAEQESDALEHLLDDSFSVLTARAVPALNLAEWEAPPLRRPLRFLLDLLDTGRQTFSDAPSTPLTRGVLANLDSLEEALVRGVADQLRTRREELPLANADRKTVLSTLDGALRRLQDLDHPYSLDAAILRQGLAILWDIRELQREKELDLLHDFVERLLPTARRLQNAPDEVLFGLQGAIADLFVFAGEDALSLSDRQEFFRQALAVCPGHRNASKLLSYSLLETANRALLKITGLPTLSARFGPLRRKVDAHLGEATRALDEAETLFPDNDLLPRYRSDLHDELQRFSEEADEAQ